MYLHLGQSVSVPHAAVIGIFDLDTTSQSRRTMEFLNWAEKDGTLETVTEDLPKSFVVCALRGAGPRVYLSQLAPATLQRRASEPL